MTGHDLSAGGDVMDRVRGCARDALAAYRGHPGASVELLNVSENATFLVSDPDTGPWLAIRRPLRMIQRKTVPLLVTAASTRPSGLNAMWLMRV